MALTPAKSKLHLTKAWANGTVAQEIQSHLTAITHNLLALLLNRLSVDHDITEKKLEAVHDNAAAKRTADELPNHPLFLITRLALQLSCQFIRTVRNLLLHPRYWRNALPFFKLRLHHYI